MIKVFVTDCKFILIEKKYFDFRNKSDTIKKKYFIEQKFILIYHMDSYFCNISKTLTQDYLAKLNCKILENENLSHFQSKRRI